MAFAEEDLTRDAFLGGRLHIWQPKTGYRAATDPVLLAAAVPVQAGETVLELGCGAGCAILCLMTRVPGVVAHGLELQEDYAELARRNAQANEQKLHVHRGDVAAPPPGLRALIFDHVLMNPPFFDAAAASAPQDSGRDLAHRLGPAGLEVWIAAALKRLRPSGRVTLIHRVDALSTILAALGTSVGDIRILPLAARVGRPAGRVIVSARKGARAPLMLLPPFVLHAGPAHLRDGEGFAPAADAILRNAELLPMEAF